MVSSCRQRVVDGGDARRRPLVAGERKRESESEAERERARHLGELGLRYPTSTPLFVPFFLFFCSINIIQLNSGPVLVNG